MTQNWLLWLNTTACFNCGSWNNCSDIWFWDMDIHRFNCSRVRGTVRSDVCSLALTCSSWSRWAVDRPVMISSHGCPSLLASLRTSVPVAMLWLPSTSLYHNPHWDPHTPPRSPLANSHTVERWHHSLSNLHPLGSHGSTLSSQFSLSQASAGLLVLCKQASLFFAQSPNIKGIPLVPLWCQPLYSGAAVQDPHTSNCGLFLLLILLSPYIKVPQTLKIFHCYT